MEKIHENMCFDVVFLCENIRTCLFTYVFLYFLHLVLTFTPHYIIMVKGLLENCTSLRPNTGYIHTERNKVLFILLQHLSIYRNIPIAVD